MPTQDPRNTTPEGEDQIISGHTYDGIEEYHNPMPSWWVWLFVIAVVWTPFYILGVHQFGWINTYEEDLAAAQETVEQRRAAAQAANPAQEVNDVFLASFMGNAANEEAGANTFAAYCAACHGSNGEGLIGPNLTDDYWIHGAAPTDLFAVITNGVLEKGMTPWESILTVEERAQLIAYLQTLRGTNPANAKEPQGELIEPGSMESMSATRDDATAS